ncbi:MAG: ketoacyl-ACP synthase III [Spirochaetaceae bacterium]|nr:MAG: ketoacyl-ACP synthase III [Spirochaetaceae bacterium]
MNAVICATGTYVPERRMSNHEFEEYLDTSDEWIVSHTGIRYRHIAADDQAASDLATEAAKKALHRAEIDPAELDMILLATATPDFVGFPGTACIVQDNLGAKNAAAMDLVAGCTGFIYGLETAKGFISSGFAKKVLLIGAEVLSRHVNWQDRNTCVLFGDGAGAAILCADEGPAERGVLYSYIRSLGSGARLLERTAGGSRFPYKQGETDPNDLLLKMDGRKVYNFAVSSLVETIDHLLDYHDLSVDDIKYIIPHQANLRIIEAAAKRKKIPLDRFYVNIQEFANTSAATIPIALAELQGKHMLQEGDLLIAIGFGAGLTYGGNLIRW